MKKGDVKSDKLYFAHRCLSDADVYFLDNHTDVALADTFTFRSVRRAAELWNSVDGRRYALPLISTDSVSMSLALRMSPRESYFIVLSDQPDTLPSVMWPGSGREEEISGSWDVYFAPEWGGPGHVTFHELTDWDGTRRSSNQILFGNGNLSESFLCPSQYARGKNLFETFGSRCSCPYCRQRCRGGYRMVFALGSRPYWMLCRREIMRWRYTLSILL